LYVCNPLLQSIDLRRQAEHVKKSAAKKMTTAGIPRAD